MPKNQKLYSTSIKTIKGIVNSFPLLKPYLSERVRYLCAGVSEYKTYDFYLSTLERMVNSVYNGDLSGEFIDIMSSLIQGQLTQAYEQAWQDEEGEGELPDYLTESLENMILDQYDYVDAYYESIVDARIDNTPIEPLLTRAQLWANRWQESYNEAVRLIALNEGENLLWSLGEAEEHCSICSRLDGIVARASEWDELGVRPQNAPNPMLSKNNGGCEGWRCTCSLEVTDKRRSPKAFESIMNIVSK